MKQLWQQLENHLSTHNPELLADLNPPATDAQIRELEKTIGIKLPADFVACLKIHDGQKGGADYLFGDYEFLSIARTLDAWIFWKKQSDSGHFRHEEVFPEGGVKSEWWSLAWVPFAYNNSGDYLCVDVGPDAGGVVGQIVAVWHDDGARKVKAKSLSEFLEKQFGI